MNCRRDPTYGMIPDPESEIEPEVITDHTESSLIPVPQPPPDRFEQAAAFFQENRLIAIVAITGAVLILRKLLR